MQELLDGIPPPLTPEEERQAILDALPRATRRTGRPLKDPPAHVREIIEAMLAQGISPTLISRCLVDVYPIGRTTIRRMLKDGRLAVREPADAAPTMDVSPRAAEH